MTAPKTATKTAKPADRKPKVTTKDGVMSATLRGKRWEIEEAALNDWEVIEDLNIVENEQNPAPMPRILKALLGDTQYREAMELLRDPKTKRISLESGADFLGELFEVFSPNS